MKWWKNSMWFYRWYTYILFDSNIAPRLSIYAVMGYSIKKTYTNNFTDKQYFTTYLRGFEYAGSVTYNVTIFRYNDVM